MPRPRFSALVRRPPRILILAAPAALALAAAVFALFNAHRALTRATASAASSHRIPFTIAPLSPLGQSAFEPVASAPAYTAGAFLAGNLYLAGPDGLAILNSDGTPNLTLRTGVELPVAPIAALAEARVRGASEPELLIATAGAGLLLLQPNGTAAPTLHQLLPADSDAADLTSLLPLATGDLLLGTRHRGVLVWNGANLTPLAFTLPGIDPSKLQVTALAAVDSASFLIATRDSGVFYAHAGTFQHADSAAGLLDDQVESLAVAAGHAYAGTPIGTADFDLAAPAFRPVRTLAEGLFAHTLAVQSGTLLVGTLDQGVQTVPLAERPQLRRASIAAAEPSETSQRIDGFLAAPEALFALSNGTLLRREGAVWAPALPPPSHVLADRNVSALAFAPDGSLYVGFFDHGLDILDPQGSVTHLEDDHLFCVNRLALDPARQTVAAATANGLVLFDARGIPRQTLTRRDGLLSDHVTDIAFTSTGTALATPAGITFVDYAGTSSLYAFQGLVNNHVYTLAARPGSAQLVAGTLGGLSILQSEAVQRNLTVANSGLKHNWVTALLPTPNDTWLVGTYGAGLQTLDREGHFAPVELPAGTPRDLIVNPNALYASSTHLYAGTLAHGMLIYSNATGRWTQITAGLPSLNVTSFAARQGELFIGTEDGLVRIAEGKLP